MRFARLMFASLCALLLAACAAEPNLNPTAQLGDMTNQPPTASTPQAEARPCPITPAEPALAQQPDLTAYPAAIEAFLSAGGTVANLEAALRSYALWDAQRGQIRQGDLTGNGFLDVVVTLLDPAQYSSIPPGGVMFVYGCEETAYRLLYTLEHPADEMRSIPFLLYADDINGDGRGELIYDVQTCGAHTCFSDIHVVNWDAAAGTMIPLLTGYEPAPTGSFEVYDVGQDGTGDFIVYTGMVGSAGAGPQRAETLTYTWNGSAFAESSRTAGAPQYRIHAMQDAIAALNAEDMGVAAALFGQVIGDASLIDAEFRPAVRQELSAFAAYGLLLVRAREGGYASPQAQAAYEALQTIIPAGAAGSIWIGYGTLFWNSFQASQDIHAACQAVVSALGSDAANPLGIFEYGYENPIPEPAALCPF